MNDHRKTWKFELGASPAECIDLFAESFGMSVGMLRSANWDVEKRGSSAIATYVGRSGLGALADAKGRGAQVTFRVDSSSNEATVCSMRLTEYVTRGAFVEDVGIIRKYMQNVGDQFQQRYSDAVVSLA
ncbi:MAG: hypothetical protein ACPHCI_08145 [Solirubrobacterales bacterium]